MPRKRIPLRSQEQEFGKEKDTLSSAEAGKKQDEIKKRIYNFQKLTQEREKVFDRAYNELVNKMKNETVKIVADIAKKKGFSAVLTQDAVMLSLPEMDITDEVIARLNDTVKKIPIDWTALKEAEKEKEKNPG